MKKNVYRLLLADIVIEYAKRWNISLFSSTKIIFSGHFDNMLVDDDVLTYGTENIIHRINAYLCLGKGMENIQFDLPINKNVKDRVEGTLGIKIEMGFDEKNIKYSSILIKDIADLVCQNRSLYLSDAFKRALKLGVNFEINKTSEEDAKSISYKEMSLYLGEIATSTESYCYTSLDIRDELARVTETYIMELNKLKTQTLRSHLPFNSLLEDSFKAINRYVREEKKQEKEIENKIRCANG